MSYEPIENYGIIGDLHTVALVSTKGSIDWMCFPYFDSPALFTALLDDQKGGRFLITPTVDVSSYRQFYWSDTNILVTRFMAAEGMADLTDWMPIAEDTAGVTPRMIIRRLEVTRGTLRFRLQCQPTFNYARSPHELTLQHHQAVFKSDQLTLCLSTSIKLEQLDNGGVGAEWELEAGSSLSFVLCALESADADLPHHEVQELFDTTLEYWHSWIAQCSYTGRWREMVHRSALVLKLLTFKPTGALIAAPTTSLPESIGGERNWDYRYTWLRDAAFTLYGLLRIGFTSEAASFMEWLSARCFSLDKPNGPLHPMYSIHGDDVPAETELDHLAGYQGSQPVRIGNNAAHQLQLDIYGELLDAVYLFNKYGTPISYELWTQLRDILDWLCEHWDQPDDGIWEIRSQRQHFVYSRVMCWVALDRGIRLADKRSFPANRDYWLKNRDAIYKQVMDKGWHEQLEAFVQFYGSDHLDASLLIMPLVFFMSPTDPRMLQTIKAIRLPPQEGGLAFSSLVYRYSSDHTDDGVHGVEGTFSMCSFWLIEALTRAGRFDKAYLEQARYLFEQMLSYANHLGLYAEEIGSHGEALGNFPQAFTHLALISAAFNLDRALDE